MRAYAPILALLGALLTVARPADACAPAPPSGVDVAILAEEAVIIWDAVAQRQHFIRRADFRTDADKFGFIVPTPTVPELVEASADLFDALDWVTRPRVIDKHVWSGIEPSCTLMMTLGRSDKAGAAPVAGVRVLHHQAVAGYDAVVLDAADPADLSKWLAEHGYAETDTLTEWAAPYVAKGWKFTAFKLAAEGGGMATSPVRMSFATERPFYPYREPADQRAAADPQGRALRVHFFSTERVDGTLGEDGDWPARMAFAGEVTPAKVGQHWPADLLGESAYLTTFIDEANPRPGTDDVWFAKSDGGDFHESVVQEHRERFPIPIELVVIAGGIGWFIVRRRRRRA